MHTPAQPPLLHFDANHLRISGDWTLPHYAQLEQQLAAIALPVSNAQTLDLSQLQALDTAGANLLVRLLGCPRARDLINQPDSLPAARLALLETVVSALEQDQPALATKPRQTPVEMLAELGAGTQRFGGEVLELLAFVGLILDTLVRSLLHPRRWRVTSLVAQMQNTGLNALPIVALLTFLVGCVVAFLGATVLERFGASIYTVALVALAFLREFGVLLTAILLAGRTASAFTAQIGSMKVNEEIDAIRTLGLNPVELLVLPRVLALLVTLPLLTFIAMLCGIFGGAVVCLLALDISPTLFLSILHDIPARHFWVGIGKAPVYAFLIAAIGCLEGFRVSGSAASVGEHTTSSVVQSIFVVIVLDALFALFFMEMHW
ncbi:phospholipid/cholesterol/gamma-HCH transport system permease protein [Pseudomonas pohangensis]|uniref:Phospholipid/cholesterol/gamma-HCH transport system permease protein n=1 Tax=Pseudomonas pohangensis TaxID=364197 RepID=A0A1H2I1S7_9PSED|nr:ABC transporter permease [Pseudomonas pohangensis]SDU37856.1 phospholipid/cholesterol/gamma-HCH transport system permease protein [Pseudomonas pohangensis]